MHLREREDPPLDLRITNVLSLCKRLEQAGRLTGPCRPLEQSKGHGGANRKTEVLAVVRGSRTKGGPPIRLSPMSATPSRSSVALVAHCVDARIAKAAAEAARADDATPPSSILKVTLKTEQNGDWHTLH